ncbi:hypothetical protein SMAC4_12964 [Sordaria macrospora]|uniref:uncharacterized protein n=1 Tax=Sordaria macrospora TaxID=5147 RepID=UPI002B2BD4EB|nr:hypothetical protein SMAC4_12964 [Sordaria macrospora]
MPCSNCFQHNRSCIMDPSKSSSCSECIRRKRSCDGVDVGQRLSSALQESQRLEEEEGRLMKEIHDLQSRLMRTREQKLHIQKKQKTLFDRGMVEFQKDLGESSGEVEGSSASVGASVDVGDPDWLRELEALSPGSLEQLAASVGQGSGDASFQSLS